MSTLADWCEELNNIDVSAYSSLSSDLYATVMNMVAQGEFDVNSVVESMKEIEQTSEVDTKALPESLIPEQAFDAEVPGVGFIKHAVTSLRNEDLEWDAKFKEHPISKEFNKLPKDEQRDAIISAATAAAVHSRYIAAARFQHDLDYAHQEMSDLHFLVRGAITTKQPWDAESISLLLAGIRRDEHFEVNPIIRFLENWAKKNDWSDTLTEAVDKLIEVSIRGYYSGQRKLQDRLRKLCAPSISSEGVPIRLEICDSWTTVFSEYWGGLEDSDKTVWSQLIFLCDSATMAKPTKDFLDQARSLLDQLGEQNAATVLSKVFCAIGTAYERDQAQKHTAEPLSEPTLVHPSYADRLRGLIWFSSLIDDDKLLAALAGASDRCFQKVRNVGPRSMKIGNACLWLFANSKSIEAVSQLSHLRGRVKHESVRKQIEKSLSSAAEHHGLSRDELEDMAVPKCGMTEIGMRRECFGDFQAELIVQSSTRTQISWITPAGKTQKSVPKRVKDQFADEVKALKAAEKLIKQTIGSQRDRLEASFLTGGTWTLEKWRERVFDHPLLGWLARKLIWNFVSGGETTNAIWHNEDFVDHLGNAVELPASGAQVRLWHPIGESTETISKWRELLLDSQMTQPFKQAHREVYLLTDAERSTATYSNRFAGHVLKQHQFQALCQARGWKFHLMGQWDSHNIPYREFPEIGVRAEYLVDCASLDEASPAGIYLYISTDQVRFYHYDVEAYQKYQWEDDGGEQLAIEDVPALVFSEVMRDVDLFVGVASIGNDPGWQDGGPQGAYQGYWHTFSFGDLDVSATARREVLERVIPRLSIKDRCSFEEKYLVVRGDIRTYKIHIGSSNIIMEPNNQYLCIVPGGGSGSLDRVYLPFEGDQRLSVILSKAFMLAEDTKIKDPTILSQINQ